MTELSLCTVSPQLLPPSLFVWPMVPSIDLDKRYWLCRNNRCPLASHMRHLVLDLHHFPGICLWLIVFGGSILYHFSPLYLGHGRIIKEEYISALDSDMWLIMCQFQAKLGPQRPHTFSVVVLCLCFPHEKNKPRPVHGSQEEDGTIEHSCSSCSSCPPTCSALRSRANQPSPAGENWPLTNHGHVGQPSADE